MEQKHLVLNYESDPVCIDNGILLFKNVFSLDDEDIKLINSIYYKNLELSIESKDYMKNSISRSLKKNNKEYLIKDIQKILLNCLAKYCDYYPESIHSIQWQDSYQIIINDPGGSKHIFNPCSSYLKNDSIYLPPFSRQIVADICLQDTTDNYLSNFLYMDIQKDFSLSSGDIVLYPANFLWSRNEGGIIDGRSIYLRTFFNGGKDTDSDELVEKENNDIFSSYMR